MASTLVNESNNRNDNNHNNHRDDNGDNNNALPEALVENSKDNRHIGTEYSEYDVKSRYGTTKKTSIIVTILFLVLQTILIVIGMVFIFIAIKLSRTNVLEKMFIDDGKLKHDPIVFWIFGVGIILIFVGVTGIISCLDKRKILALVYMVILFGLLIGATQKSNKLFKQLNREESVFSNRWNMLTDTSKQLLQNWGNCCGFKDENDRPLLPCPSSSSSGCFADKGPLNLLIKGYIWRVLFALYSITILSSCLILFTVLIKEREGRTRHLSS